MRLVDRTDVPGQQPGVRNTGQSQRPPEGAPPLSQREAGRIKMHMCSPTRQPAAWVRLKPMTGLRPDRDEPQQFRVRRAFAAADTGAHRQPTPTKRGHTSYH